MKNKGVLAAAFLGLFLAVGAAAAIFNPAKAEVVAAAQMKDGIVILTDEEFSMCPVGNLAVAKTPDGETLPGCWIYDKEQGNIEIVWLSPPMKIPSGAFKQAPKNLGA